MALKRLVVSKPRKKPAFDEVVVGHKPQGPECRSVISTIISSVAEDVTQSKRDVAAPVRRDASNHQPAEHGFAVAQTQDIHQQHDVSRRKCKRVNRVE